MTTSRPIETTTTPAEVDEEQRLLETVLARLRRAVTGPRVANHDARLTELRDGLADEKLVDDIASIVEEMDRMAALKAQQAQSWGGKVPLDNPYFGHMVVEDDHGKRAILIGKQTFIHEGLRIVDWRNAPISRIFYQYAEGDEYDDMFAGRPVSGEVLVRRTVEIVESNLERVVTDDHTWLRTPESGWIDARAREARLAGGAGSAISPHNLGTGDASRHRDKHLPEITSLLDPRQFDLITRPDTSLVAIQGSAGSGKTTVALHRIAYLAYHDARFDPRRSLVVVFSKALGAYISKVLPALGVEGVPVVEYDAWAQKHRRRIFRGLPEVYSDETPALVSRFKTHTALLKMIDRLGAQMHGTDPVLLFEDIFTDHSWLDAGLKRWAPGEFSDDQIKQIHRWCTKQHFQRTEGGGPNEHEVACLDREDDTILLRLHQVVRGPIRRERSKRPLTYHHIMVDEAQDLSPIEHAVIVGVAGRRQSVTLAGDVAQKIDDIRDFRSWTEVLEALELSHVAVSPLQVSYRSTRQIMELARDVLGPYAPDEPLVTTRDGVPCAHLSFGGMGAAVAWLAPTLTDLMVREPTASVALLTGTLQQAVDWYRALDRAEVPSLDLVDDQDFSFLPGIEATDIRSSKGLEFDYVVVLGADRETFPNTAAARHLLHVGVTRAAHQVWLVSTGHPSPLIPADLPGIL